MSTIIDQPGLDVIVSEEELPNGFTRRQIAASISPKVLELILLPTEKCNFRCTYCYEDFELGKMSEVTISAIEQLLERRVKNLQQLRFSWFGGEPLVAKDVVLRLAKYAYDQCREHGVKFDGGLTTNAYILDKALAEQLIQLKQNFFQITLDGWREAHDEKRKRADGRGTFDVIWSNLLGLKELRLSFEVCVRVHVRRDNVSNLEILMAEFARAFQGDQRFYLDFQNLRDMGGEGGRTIENQLLIPELREIEKRLRAIYSAELNRSVGLDIVIPTDVIQTETKQSKPESQIIWQLEGASESAGSQRPSERVDSEPYICYASRPNSLLIRSNGRIGKCTVAFDDERNDLGYIAEDGSIVVNNEKLQPWIRGLGTLDTGDVGCPIQNMAAVAPSGLVSVVKFVPLQATQVQS
jgi:uncharacterized protein